MARRERVLVVDDDVTVRDVVRRYLDQAGYQVEVVGDGAAALRAVEAEPPDLVVLDLMLPGVGGLDICRRLRASLPIVILTALGAEDERVLGLQLGADDYVTKPFSPRELVLRVASVLRRANGRDEIGRPEPVRDGGLLLDPSARRVALNGVELTLTLREFDLLGFLITHPGEVFTRAELLDRVWGWSFGDESTVTVHVRRLREKVEDDPTNPQRIATVWGVGYRYDRAEG